MSNSANEFAMLYAIRLRDGSMWCSPHTGGLVTWSQREGAQEVLDQLAAHAASMGFPDFGATVVYRYCTPFISEADNADTLIDELTTWLQHQTGGGR